MASAKKKKTEGHVDPVEQTKPRAIVTMATDDTTVSSPVRTTRELYMEQIRNEDSSKN